MFREHGHKRILSILQAEGVVSLSDLSNTRARAEGVEAGLRAVHDGPFRIVRVNGQATYRTSFRVALDALRMHEDVALAFAVNDHSATAMLEAAARVGRLIPVYATGGEAPDFVVGLLEDRGLAAVAALFPEVVGSRVVDLIGDALQGRPLPAQAITPHAILTRANLGAYYRREAQGWQFIPDRRAA